MEQDYKGSLIEVIEPEDPRIRLKRLYPWVILIADFALLVFFLTFESFLPESYYVIIVAIAVLLLGVGGVFYFLLFRHVFFRTTEPVMIYSNGVEAFPSPFYRLRGLDGFIRKDRIDRIEVKVFRTISREFRTRPDQSGAMATDRLVILHTRDGKSRILWRRSQETTLRAVKVMKKVWGVPVVGIDETRSMEQPERRR